MTKLLISLFIKNSTKTKDNIVRSAYGRLAGIVGIISNFILFLTKFLAGTISGSLSITADAFNNLSDASSSIISLIGFKLSGKPADNGHPFGHARFEYLSGLTVAVFIFAIGIELLKSSVTKILHPSETTITALTYLILILSILVKLWLASFHKYIGTQINSTVLLATGADSRNDVISTTAVLITAVLSDKLGIHLDGLMGLLVALFILYSGYETIKDTLDPLLGAAPDQALVNDIHDKILTYPGVLGCHDLIVHDYGPGRQFASVHVEMAAEEDVIQCHDIIDQIETDFKEQQNLHMIIHYDPIITDDPMVQDMRHWLDEQAKNIHCSLSVHDLRIIPTQNHTRLIFDCVVPSECPFQEAQIKEILCLIVQEAYPSYSCDITIDVSFAAIPH